MDTSHLMNVDDWEVEENKSTLWQMQGTRVWDIIYQDVPIWIGARVPDGLTDKVEILLHLFPKPTEEEIEKLPSYKR